MKDIFGSIRNAFLVVPKFIIIRQIGYEACQQVY